MIFRRGDVNLMFTFMSKEKFKGVKSIIRSRFNKELMRISGEIRDEFDELKANGATNDEIAKYMNSDYPYDNLEERKEMLELFKEAIMNTEMEFSRDTEITEIGYERLYEIAQTIHFPN